MKHFVKYIIFPVFKTLRVLWFLMWNTIILSIIYSCYVIWNFKLGLNGEFKKLFFYEMDIYVGYYDFIVDNYTDSYLSHNLYINPFDYIINRKFIKIQNTEYSSTAFENNKKLVAQNLEKTRKKLPTNLSFDKFVKVNTLDS